MTDSLKQIASQDVATQGVLPDVEAPPVVDHRPTNYRERVFSLFEESWPVRQVKALDFGAGDGWFASHLLQRGLCAEVTAIDVQIQPQLLHPVTAYDGVRIPADDRQFDLSYAVDVLHHCPDPMKSLEELLRVTREWLVIKDHTYTTSAGYWTLCLLDELGNRRFGIPSRYRYMKGWEWWSLLERAGFQEERRIWPAPVHEGWLGSCTNHLQFVSVWRRSDCGS